MSPVSLNHLSSYPLVLLVHLPCVPLQVTGCFARDTAPLAFVGFLSCVLPLVNFQITTLSARIVALITLERLHP